MVQQMTFDSFLDLVGRQRFQDDLGKSTQLVTRAKSDGIMPAHWFRDVRNWCVRNQIDVPEHLFRWDINKQNANFTHKVQDTLKEISLGSSQ